MFFIIISGPALVTRSESGVTIRPGVLIDHGKQLIRGIVEGTTFDYMAKRTPYSMTETLPSYFSLSFRFILPSALISLLLGTVAGIGLSFRTGPVIEGLLSFFHALPDFLLAVFLQLFSITFYQTFGVRFARLAWQHAESPAYLLPVLTMTVTATVFVIRTVEGYARQVQGQEYMLYARSRGLPDRHLIGRHLLVPVLHFLQSDLERLLVLLMANLFIIERIFAIPGLTAFLFHYAFDLDILHYPVLAQVNVAFWGFLAIIVMYRIIHTLLRLLLGGIIRWRQL